MSSIALLPDAQGAFTGFQFVARDGREKSVATPRIVRVGLSPVKKR